MITQMQEMAENGGGRPGCSGRERGRYTRCTAREEMWRSSRKDDSGYSRDRGTKSKRGKGGGGGCWQN